MKIFFRTLFFLLILINSVNSEVIKNIKVDGNQRISTETIKIFTELELNKDYDLNELNDVVKRLYITNYFENINIKILNNVLYINVIENPIVQSLKFEGVKNKRILEVLRDKTQIKEKSPFIENKVKRDVEIVNNILRTNGYYFSKVSSKYIKNDNNTIDLIFEIDLGEKAFIKKITFIGDKKIKDNKLRKIIVSEEAKFWKFISNKKFLDINRIKLDETLLYNYYKNRGYYNVKIDSSSAIIINETDFELIFNINSGKKYYFGDVNLLIPDEYSEESFNKIIGVMDDLDAKVYSLQKIKKLLNKIDEIALTKEFEFINAKYDEVIKGDKIYLNIKLEELDKFYVEKINIYGNYITNENVLRNLLVVDEGDPYNKILVNKSINNIKSKRIFKEVKKQVVDGSSNDLKIINITVDEQATGEISAGAGAGTSGNTLSFGIKENNYLGSGVKVNTQFSFSDTGTQAKLSTNNPNYNNSDRSLFTSIETSKSDQMSRFGYKTTKTGFSFGTNFEQYEDIYFSPSFSNYLETLKTSSTASEAKKKQKGDYFDSSFNYGLTLNKLNQNFQPTSGFISKFYQSLPIYSDDYSVENRYEYAKFVSPNDNAILSFRFFAHSINSVAGDDVRVSKRLYIPGKRLKGFEYGKIGPKDSGDYIGGNFATAFNFTTTLPGFLSNLEDLDFSFFIDAGNVWGVDYDSSLDNNNKIRSSTGLAVDWFTPVGPLNFSLSQPITKSSSDTTETFRFDIGTTF